MAFRVIEILLILCFYLVIQKIFFPLSLLMRSIVIWVFGNIKGNVHEIVT